MVTPPPRSMTTFKAALKADWAPAIKSTARFVGVAIACVIVAADWLRFTWQHPWAGLRALELPNAAASSPRSAASSPRSATSSPRSEPSSPNLTTSDLNKAGASISETELGPMSMRMDFGMARPTLPVAPQPPIAPAPAPRKRGRRATRQPKAA